MYGGMDKERVVEEDVAGVEKRGKGRKGRRLDSIGGEEAWRVRTAIDLGPGDLVSDSQAGVVMELLAGARVSSLLKRLAAGGSGKDTRGAKTDGASGRLLPWIDDAGERLRLSVGAALSVKTLGRARVVVACVGDGEGAEGVWGEMLAADRKVD